MFDLIAFDADDTLWHNESLYRQGRELFRKMMAKYPLAGDIDELIHEIEINNLEYFGYGVVSFVLSLIESAIDLTNGQVSNADIQDLINFSRDMISAEVKLFDHARETVEKLSVDFPLMLITKGDLLHQQIKVEKSGMGDYFDYIEIVSDKKVSTYAAILQRYDISPSRFLMVGNSLRSDILPVIELGGWVVYVPNELTWMHENVDLPDVDYQRYYEVEHLGNIPSLLASLNPSSGNYE
jgi:putative hydrolase of the HAD superfamily